MYGVLALIAFFVAAGTPDLSLAAIAGLAGFGLTFLSIREMRGMGFFYNELEEADK